MREHSQKTQIIGEFSEAEKAGQYKAINERRDARDHFVSAPVPDGVLRKLLDAAHHAGSVGFMQRGSFIVIRSQELTSTVEEKDER